MNQLFRIFAIAGLFAVLALILAVGLARNDSNLLAPLHLLLLVAALALYLIPAGLALYRDCRSTLWIVLLDVFLGWTIFGWFAAMGWAASGKIRPLPPPSAPPVHPLPSH